MNDAAMADHIEQMDKVISSMPGQEPTHAEQEAMAYKRMADEIREVWCELVNDGYSVYGAVAEIERDYDIPNREVWEILNGQAGV